jgi:hypothetical protein
VINSGGTEPMPSLPFIVMEGGEIRLMAFKELMLPESKNTCIL